MPEFDKHLPNWVMRSRDVNELANQLEEIIENPGYSARYPIRMHSIDNVISKYYEVLCESRHC